MNTLLRCCITGIAAAGLAACASHGTMRHQPVAAADASGRNYDVEYVQMVEHVARRRGVDVQWVNPPKKRLVASSDDQGPD